MPSKPKQKYTPTPLGNRLKPKYTPPFKPMTPARYDMFAARDLAMKGR